MKQVFSILYIASLALGACVQGNDGAGALHQEVVLLDSDDDGISDCIDFDDDGVCDMELRNQCEDPDLDLDNDGVSDGLDLNCDGTVDMLFCDDPIVDEDLDGIPDGMDLDCDGSLDLHRGGDACVATQVDTDQDGVADSVDLDCDGTEDRIPPSCSPDRSQGMDAICP